MNLTRASLFSVICISFLSACDGDVVAEYPVDPELERVASRGKITGEGLVIAGGDNENNASGGMSPIGVNSFLWRATLDSIAFMPLASADPFGGVIITDWYADPTTPGERFKLNILILDRQLRADSLKATAFRQLYNSNIKGWQDVASNPSTARSIEDAILTRAREMRVQQSMR